MLDLARTSAPRVAEAVGYENCDFVVGNIQDLALDLEKIENWLAENPVQTREDLLALREEEGAFTQRITAYCK